MKTRAIVFTAPSAVAIIDTLVSDPAENEVLIQTVFSCVSPGTELRCLAGQQNAAPAFPFVPGYALAGRILQVGANVQNFREGDTVFCTGSQRMEVNRCWGGHIAHAVANQNAVFPVPEGVSLRDAVLTKMAAICLRGAKMSRPLPWETVAVVGLGLIGHLAARVHGVSGARVIGVDTLPGRADALRRAGIEALVAAPDTIAETVRALLPGGADIVVDATGYDGAANQAILLARETGFDDTPAVPARYLVQGSYPESVAFPYIPAFARELTVLFSRDTRPQDLRDVLDLMKRGKLNLDGVLGQPFAPDDAPQVYADLQARKGNLLTAAFQWSPE